MQKNNGNGKTGNDEVWLTCVAFVEANIQKIKKEARTYLYFSACEMSDFVQEAYICAYKALQSCPCYKGKGESICNPCQPIKCVIYKSLFWNVIKSSFTKQVDRCTTRLFSEPYKACQEDTANQTLTQANLSYHHFLLNKNRKKINKMLKLVIQNMTERQAEAWTQYIYENSETHYEIALKMNISRQRVDILLKEGVMRAKSRMMFLMGASVGTRY